MSDAFDLAWQLDGMRPDRSRVSMQEFRGALLQVERAARASAAAVWVSESLLLPRDLPPFEILTVDVRLGCLEDALREFIDEHGLKLDEV